MRSVVGTLLVKYLLVAGLSVAILPATSRVLWMQALWIAVVVAGVAYAAVDRVVLRAAGNAGAVVADFVLGVALFWLAPLYAPGTHVPLGGALVAGGAVSVAEILYHQFLLERGVGLR